MGGARAAAEGGNTSSAKRVQTELSVRLTGVVRTSVAFPSV